MAGSSRKKSDTSSGSLPADVDLETLYGAVGLGRPRRRTS